MTRPTQPPPDLAQLLADATPRPWRISGPATGKWILSPELSPVSRPLDLFRNIEGTVADATLVVELVNRADDLLDAARVRDELRALVERDVDRNLSAGTLLGYVIRTLDAILEGPATEGTRT